MKFLQVNTSVNSGSTGRIAEDIGRLLRAKGHESYIAYSIGNQTSASKLIRIGSKWDFIWHGFRTRLFDQHGFGSVAATRNLVKQMQEIKPDLIHLHNLHGYYLSIHVLFNYLRTANLSIVWTLHDCWPFTGHCCYFDAVDCDKWQTGCFNCSNKNGYPQSWFYDNSKHNFHVKKCLFTAFKQIVFVVPSKWLGNHLNRSFLKTYPVKIIHNGIDIERFHPVPNNPIRIKYDINDRKIILGVAGVWDRRKGLDDFIKLHRQMNHSTVIVLVGLTPSQIKKLPAGMIGITRTENIEELVALYSAADVFVNPTWVDNFPTTNIEALACGTPVITYNTGGSQEAIDSYTGKVVNKGEIGKLSYAVKAVLKKGKDHYLQPCRQRAEKMFNSQDRYNDYYELYLQVADNRN